MFTTKSALVSLWVKNVNNGNYERVQVPKLSNLQEMVYEVIDAQVTE